ncbi:sigma-54 dependent transcriptional regulator [Gaetbulibacter aquiaggeris]|uniref:Sigma-54 dependent transcriptional regulator n=1 Tax=Gaetbulibacter aquiaggeris TaxID=1735373 RepID=A0ABW7MPP1_9FLAO
MRVKDATILIIDDDKDVLTAFQLLLKPLVKEVILENNPNNIPNQLKEKAFDVIFLDMNFNALVNTGNEGIFWLNKIKKMRPEAAVVLMTAYADIDIAIKSLKEGASDFIVKPWKNAKILEAVETVIKSKTKDKAPQTTTGDEFIIGESAEMADVFIKIKKLGPTDANVLILGENGTGKDLVARALHDHSNRSQKPFIKVDVGALTPSLFESELFGYKKGAFTDAREDREGRFVAANGGTLFLDEIGNITLEQQARLLSVLQNRQVTPLGSNEVIDLDIRLICATNVAPDDLADEGKFRKDLIYRINTVDISLPALRNRKSDLVLLAKHFAAQYSDKYNKSNLELEKDFISKLKNHEFPGNVRELQYVMERAVIMAEGSSLTAEDLVFSSIERSVTTSNESDSLNLDDVEKNTILKVLEKYKGNISKSAKELGITRAALYRRIEKYEI